MQESVHREGTGNEPEWIYSGSSIKPDSQHLLTCVYKDMYFEV